MSDIVLSAGVRQNLLALQSTAQLMSVTQNRLATGKKVNSALDNPANFFTAQSLNNRANDLNALLDSIGQAQQTLAAADKGLTALTKLVESAKSIAKSARQSPQPTSNTFSQITLTGAAQAETLNAGVSGSFAASNTQTYSFAISIAGGAATTISYVSDASATVAEIAAGLNTSLQTAVTAAGLPSGAITFTNPGGNNVTLAAPNGTDFDITSVTVGNDRGAGLAVGTHTSTTLLDNIIAAGGTAGQSTLTLQVNGGQTQTLTFGTGPGQVSTYAQLNTALGNISNLTASVTGTVTSFIVNASASQNNLTLASTTGVNTALGIAANINQNGTLTSTVGSDPTRASLQGDFNEVIQQIDQLAKDTGYNGINLLYGDTLKVVFNENGTSTLIINGVTFDSAGLGLSTIAGNGFQADATIDTTITALDSALVKLRAQASKFGANLNTVQTRQDFTKSLIATLKTGSDSLVLADPNEEGANMLALQTRQQLSTTALSLSAQADQAVLRLFG